MIPAKQETYMDNLETVLDLYHHTSMRVSEIARTVRLSETTCHKMVEGKYPKWYVKQLATHGRYN